MAMESAFDREIASQPGAVRETLSRVEIPPLDADRPIVFTGVGASPHACRVAAARVSELATGALRLAALDAHELARSAPLKAADRVVVVGGEMMPDAVLDRAAWAPPRWW